MRAFLLSAVLTAFGSAAWGQVTLPRPKAR